MKTEMQVRSEMDEIREKYAVQYKFKKKELDKARRKLIFLEKCLKYLKSDCEKEPYLRKELETLSKRLLFIDDNFGTWCSSNRDIANKYDNPLPVYRRELGRAKVIKQITTLKYLLL